MICPHCSYEHNPENTWNDLRNEFNYDAIWGKRGAFYSMPVKLERVRHQEDYNYDTEPAMLYACPSCMKTFVEGV